MDWAIVATSAVSLISWFITKTGESLAQKTGQEVFDLLKLKFKKDKKASNTLEYFFEDQEHYRSALVNIIRERAESDTEFGEKLSSIVSANQTLFADDKGINQINQNIKGDGNIQNIGNNNRNSSNVQLGKSESRKKR